MVWLGKSHFCDLITQKIPVAMQQPKIVLYVRLNELKSIKLKNCWSWIYCSLFYSDQINSSEDIQILLSDNQLISDSPLLTMKNMKAKGWTYGKQQKHDFVHMWYEHIVITNQFCKVCSLQLVFMKGFSLLSVSFHLRSFQSQDWNKVTTI